MCISIAQSSGRKALLHTLETIGDEEEGVDLWLSYKNGPQDGPKVQMKHSLCMFLFKKSLHNRLVD